MNFTELVCGELQYPTVQSAKWFKKFVLKYCDNPTVIPRANIISKIGIAKCKKRHNKYLDKINEKYE